MADRVVIQFSTAAPASFVPFSKGWSNRYSKAIRMLGHTYFSHADFLIDVATACAWLHRIPSDFHFDYALLGASNNPSAPVISGNPRGVALRPPDYQSFGMRRRMVLMTPHADEILAYAWKQVGRPFDSGALSPKVFLADPFLGSVESRDWRDPTQWFCEELIVCCFEQGNYWGKGVKVPTKKNRLTPADGLLIHMMDPNFVNRDTFYDPIPDVQMGPYES